MFPSPRLTEMDPTHAQALELWFTDVRLGDSGWLRSSTHGAKKFLQKNGEYYEGQPCRSAGRRGLVARESVAKGAS